MKALLSAMALAAFGANLQAGVLFGSVKAQPSAGMQERGGASGKYESRQFKFVETVKYDEIKDFVVYLDQPMANPTAKPAARDVITQKDAVFRPHVMPVLVGTEVRWPNKDDIFHNVFSESFAKTFDLGLYKDPEIKSVTFDKSGRVDVFCSIHSKMSCVVLVLENPFFAATDEKGNFRITGIPAGTYRFKAWHERLPGQVKEVTIPAEGEVRMDFTVGVRNLPKAPAP